MNNLCGFTSSLAKPLHKDPELSKNFNGRTWIILGGTSIIAEEFARLAAQAGYSLVLVGRNIEQLEIISADLRLRFATHCTFFFTDFDRSLTPLLEFLLQKEREIDLFIAHSAILTNEKLNLEKIKELCQVNVSSTVQIIHTYLSRLQATYRIVFLSSASACRGRAKNSLYGGTKRSIETYLEGLQQGLASSTNITIARLGFIDTSQTFGLPGIFYAASPKNCAKSCWKAVNKGKRLFYYPFFWRYIMAFIKRLPFFIYSKWRF